MKLIKFGDNLNGGLCLALGFFDCVHIGHRDIIGAAADYARSSRCLAGVFTFADNPARALGRSEQLVYTLSERLPLFAETGAAVTLAAEAGGGFTDMPAQRFLEMLSCYDLRFLTCGSDYRFGKGGEGDTRMLAEFCLSKNITLDVRSDVVFEGVRASSTVCRRLLSDGRVKTAGTLLASPYRACGVLNACRGDDGEFCLKINADKLPIKRGKYKCYCYQNLRKIPLVAHAIGADIIVRGELEPDEVTLYFEDIIE